jgi:predicted ATPase
MELAGHAGTSTVGELSRVQSVVAARLALLSDEARTTAEVAAAVGRDFQFDLLARASDLEEPVLVRALDELWRRHIVRVQADERWDFSHDRIREVAYGGIGPARRRLIHRRIAQGMELVFAGRLDEVSASLAVHLDRGGQVARAVPVSGTRRRGGHPGLSERRGNPLLELRAVPARDAARDARARRA